MTRQETLELLRAAVAEETDFDASALEETSTAGDVPGWDSLAHVRILFNLEQRLDASFDIAGTYDLDTIGDLVTFLTEQAG